MCLYKEGGDKMLVCNKCGEPWYRLGSPAVCMSCGEPSFPVERKDGDDENVG